MRDQHAPVAQRAELPEDDLPTGQYLTHIEKLTIPLTSITHSSQKLFMEISGMTAFKRWQAFLMVGMALVFFGCSDSNTSMSPQQENVITPFYGTYSGSGKKMLGDSETVDRDLSVTIKPWEDKGFTIDWGTVIYRGTREKETNMSINFKPSPRPGIFTSAMQTNTFGNSIPFNPAVNSDEPYVWAGLEGNTLTVHALYIMDDGGYEMQVYRRSLQDNGMTVEFERMKNSERVTQIEARLESVK